MTDDHQREHVSARERLGDWWRAYRFPIIMFVIGFGLRDTLAAESSYHLYNLVGFGQRFVGLVVALVVAAVLLYALSAVWHRADAWRRGELDD